MWDPVIIAAGVATIGFVLSGCGDEVTNPISPEQARAEVIDAARDIRAILHADVAKANFSYESCNDQGEPPFRGVVHMSLWMPGVAHDEPVQPEQVLPQLAAHGWSSDSDWVSHSHTMRKGDVNVMVDVVSQIPANRQIGGHVGADIYGQCRDTFDHRADHTVVPVDVDNEIEHS